MGVDDYNTNYGWDARDLYLKEAVGRGHLVLNSNKLNIYEWYENLCDFYDWTACAFEQDKNKNSNKLLTEEIEEELQEIEKYVYQKQYSKEEEIRAKEEAYKRMRKVFRKINLKMWEKGLYVPKKKIRPFGDAIND